MTQDDRMETITDPAEIRATDDPDERTTPAPVGAAVALDLDAAHVRTDPACTFHDGATPKASRGKSCPACMRLDLDALHETICDKFTGMAEVRQAADLLVAEVRRLTRLGQCDLDLLMRAEAAEAEVVTLRAQVNGLHEELLRGDPDVVTLRARLAAVEALADQWADRKRSDGMSGNAWIGLKWRRMLAEPTGQDHRCSPYWSRSICGGCGGQEANCDKCGRLMCCEPTGQEGDQ